MSYGRYYILIFSIIYLCFATQVNSQNKEKKPKNDYKQTVQISGDFVRASLETTTSFESKNSLLIAKISLEDNLGLVKSKIFFSGTVIWRITPRSGVFGSFYSIYRQKEYTVKQDIPYLDTLLPQGSRVEAYFGTNVTSIGYLFTIVEDKKSLLAAYLNIYLMKLRTGVSSQGIILDRNQQYLAPLPNFGLIAKFQINSWLAMKGRFGMFYLSIDDFSGRVSDLDVGLNVRLTKWLGINASYKAFDLRVVLFDDIQTTVEYNFRGPALGVSLNF